MNKRQKKKQIPSCTDYCYKVIKHDTQSGGLTTEVCPHYKFDRYENDIMMDSKGNEHPAKRPVYYCSYTKVSSEEDFLLADQVKICGEKLPKNYFY